MKTALQLNQSLKQSLSTELQQAIELLAMPAIELKLHIQSVLDNNPLLELDEQPVEAPHSIFDLLPYWQTSSDFPPDIPDTQGHTIKAHLLWQLSLSHWSERELLIATYLIDGMNDEGHLESTVAEIHSSIPTHYKSTVPEMQTLLLRIQQFERLSFCDPHYRPISHDMHIPDLLVGKQNGHYVVTLNMDFIPELKMVSHYADNFKKAGTARDKKFMVHARKEARWFLKALHIRNQHLLQTAEAIVCHQYPFLEYGAKAIVPLHYHHISRDTGLHESTISRLVCNKLILTPQGLFELRSFFGNGTQPLQAMIKQLVAEEPRENPVSDQQLTQLLLSRGFKTTRRTVAKYREAMEIPSSYHRKRGITYGNSNNRS